MITATIKRMKYSDAGTFGYMRVQKDGHEKSYVTAELPWRGNKRGISCIPSGEYDAACFHSPNHNRLVYLLKDVPKRDMIEIHVGNWAGDVDKGYVSDVKGCILIGLALGKPETRKGVAQDGVVHSAAAMRDLLFYTAGADMKIVIIGDKTKEV